MILRVVRRAFRFAAVLAAGSVASLAIAAGLAVWPPGFYADWRDRAPTAQEVQAATARVNAQRESYLRWRVAAAAAAAQRGEAAGPAPPPPTPHEVSVTDGDLNRLLAAETRDALRSPCFRVTEGRIAVAAALPPELASLVVSCELAPRLTADGVAVLDIHSARVGRLPLPVGLVARFLPSERSRVSGNLYLDLTAGRPRLTLDLGDRARSLRAQSLRCLDGRVVVRFAAATAPAG
ncbi:MAG: hypothetical protein AAF805_06210 [Planctomycetota bacterium]